MHIRPVEIMSLPPGQCYFCKSSRHPGETELLDAGPDLDTVPPHLLASAYALLRESVSRVAAGAKNKQSERAAELLDNAVDAGFDTAHGGRVYVCGLCIDELGRAIGRPGPEKVDELRSERDAARQQASDLGKALDAAEGKLDAAYKLLTTKLNELDGDDGAAFEAELVEAQRQAAIEDDHAAPAAEDTEPEQASVALEGATSSTVL